MLKIDFVIASMNNPNELSRVVNEVLPLVNIDYEKFIIVATKPEDVNDDIRIAGVEVIYLEPTGSCVAMHHGFMNSKAEWICYLNDDISFFDNDWFDKAKQIIRTNRELELISFNDFVNGVEKSKGIFAAFGIMKRELYLKYWSDNPYLRYFWDNEAKDYAEQDGVYKRVDDIKLDHFWDRGKLFKRVFKQDKNTYNNRRRI